MTFFKFRKGGEEQAAPAAQPESVDVLRRRAKNRLIGAAILVLIGVVGFPLLVDKQPRPVDVDLPIEIPDRSKVPPLAAPEMPAQAPAEMSSAPVEPASVLAAPAAVPSTDKTVAEKPADTSAARAPARPAASRPEPKPARSETKADARKTESKPAHEGRYVVQVGSFADENRAREVHGKLERAGLKNYTQVVETKDGRRIRVRAGPYGSKAEAERAAEKLKRLDLPATVLSL